MPLGGLLPYGPGQQAAPQQDPRLVQLLMQLVQAGVNPMQPDATAVAQQPPLNPDALRQQVASQHLGGLGLFPGFDPSVQQAEAQQAQLMQLLQAILSNNLSTGSSQGVKGSPSRGSEQS